PGRCTRTLLSLPISLVTFRRMRSAFYRWSRLSPDRPMSAHPHVPMRALDTLWFQVAGTLCNIECTHCFISSSPTNRSHGMLSLVDVEWRLAEARELGVREYYFTGGEPFMNRDMLPLLEVTLRQGPATVLPNGMLLPPDRA